MSFKRLALGQSGEKMAARHLTKKGHTILEKNFRSHCGEIDLITKHHDIIIFTEVKTRSTCALGSPLAAVTQQKQRQISKVALEYLSRRNLLDCDARFDVVSIITESKRKPVIEHIENAFDLCYGF